LAEDRIAADIAAIARIEAVPTILDLLCRLTGMGFAAVARVTDDRWIACAVRDDIGFGLVPGGELEIGSTICNEIRASGEAVVIDHVDRDPSFQAHHTPARYGFQSYISMPIRHDGGRFFGTLCAIDPRPARLNRPEVITAFTLFADLIGMHLEMQDRLGGAESALATARAQAELRDQFIAVLGHDLRNPLASIAAAGRVLKGDPSGPHAGYALAMIQGSVDRMSTMIDNILDFARGRLGDGLLLEHRDEAELDEIILQTVAEMRAAHPDRAITAAIAIDGPVRCDPSRIGRLVSNLLGNALRHGAPEAPIALEAATRGALFELSVANQGEPIPPERQARLFLPFFRQAGSPAEGGLGLGLFISAEIAKAHGGSLTVDSTASETRFTLRIPRG
jgi:signal transduction histidine kinase